MDSIQVLSAKLQINGGSMPAHRLRRRPNNKQSVFACMVSVGMSTAFLRNWLPIMGDPTDEWVVRHTVVTAYF